MAKLKFEIDTDDIFQDYDEEFGPSGASFESLFKEGITKEITKKVTEDVSKAKIDEISEAIRACVEVEVERKLTNLINEDVAFTNKWGKPEFVGSVEDYIKKQIDEKMLLPVDGYGKPLQGCSSSSKTWIGWKVEKSIQNQLQRVQEVAQKQAFDFCKKTLTEELEKFKTSTLRGAIVSHLDSLGIIKS